MSDTAAQKPAASVAVRRDPCPANFDPLEVFELMAETAIAAGAERPALRSLLERIQAVTDA
jgi:hypothetical protein